jgi:hypothetical protein
MAIFPIIWEMINVVNVYKVHNFIENINKSKGLKFDEMTANQKGFSVMSIGYIAWIIAGLFTFQWSIFVCFLVIGMIPKIFAWYRWVDSFVTLIALMFVIINAYHLQIDVNTLIINLITNIF